MLKLIYKFQRADKENTSKKLLRMLFVFPLSATTMFQESFLVLKYPAARKKEKRLIIIHFEVLTKKIFNGMALHFILYPAPSSLIFEIENQGL